MVFGGGMMLMVPEESGWRRKLIYRSRCHGKVMVTPVLVLYTVENFVLYRLESDLSKKILIGCMNVNHSTPSLFAFGKATETSYKRAVKSSSLGRILQLRAQNSDSIRIGN